MSAAGDLKSYLKSVHVAHGREDGNALAALLSLEDGHIQRVHQLVHSENPEDCAKKVITSDQNLARAVAAHLKVASKMMNNDIEQAFTLQCTCCEEMAEYIRDEANGNWQLKALNIVMLDLLKMEKNYEDQLETEDQRTDTFSCAMRAFQDCFRGVANDPQSDIARSKKVGMMLVANHMFNLSFRHNNFAFVNAITRTIDNNANVEQYQPMCHRVTFYYYRGRKAILDAAYRYTV